MRTVLFLGTRLGIGGAEQIWAKLLTRLDRNRFRPLLGCLYDPGVLGENLKQSGVTVYSDLAAHRWDLRILPRLLSLLRREHVDLLYIINQPFSQFWGTLCGKLAGTPVLITSIHSTGKISRVHRRLWINQLTFPFMDRVTALSETHKTYLAEQEGIDPKKIEIIPNGIEVDRFASAEARNGLRSSFGIENGEPIVGIVAMLRPEKSHDIFLQAAGKILRKNPKAHFLVVGDGPERPRLEMLTQKLNLSSRVHFVGARNDVPEIISLFDVGVLSSQPVVETLSVSVLEYMASGKPVVATRVGSLPEIVEEARSGFLVEPGDAESLADRILQLLDDQQLARQMGARGHERVAREYTVEQMVKKTEDLFERLLKDQEASRCA